MLADLILKEKSHTIDIRKGMFLNINCSQFMFRNIPFLILLANNGKYNFQKPVNKKLFLGKKLKFHDFSIIFFSSFLISLTENEIP